MFNLEQSIQDWRRQIKIRPASALDELETHLRDEVEAQINAGNSIPAAFESAAAKLGQAEALTFEFEKIGRARGAFGRIQEAFFVLAGISNSEVQLEMNTLSSKLTTEPRWATYTKAAAFLSPSIVLWTFSVIWLFPKLQQICKQAGVAMPSVFGMTSFIAENTLLIVAATLLLLALLEWRSSTWARYRRASIGGAVFAFNTAVLVLITLMVVLALLAAPGLMHSGN